ncbi:MAG TPA: DNA-3-methyladenine glycosylase I [Nitrospirales bacterium]|nr:DNA-3-methyladenine glycosylase I [Nitrospirales bacterium]
MGRTTRLQTQKPIRCGWVGTKSHFIPYHDEEWGIPVHEDHRHFEMLTLEGAQAGLSWSTILLRREGYRRAFAAFDPEKVARFDSRKIAVLLQDTGIIRNRLKIESTVTNAKAFLTIQETFGSFDQYIWDFVGGAPIINDWKAMAQVPATTPQSDALSKDLKQRGFRFVGSTVIYAHMQAAGLVNDHTTDCFRHPSNLRPQTSSQVAKVPNKSNYRAIKVKRIYDTPAPDDGCRILIDRLWPRGLSKEAAKADLWQKDLAPSTALRNWFHHEPKRWEEFQRRYAKELGQKPKAVEELWQRIQQGPVTLLFGAKNQECNHALALKAYLSQNYE